MKKFADVLKIFIEKHLIPSVISIAGAIIILLVLPTDNWVVIKIGNLSAGILAFCICFLTIQFIIKIVNAIKKALSNLNEFNYRMKQNELEKQEIINQINEFVDRLTPEDKNLLISFIKNGNKILIAFERMEFGNSLLDNTHIMNIAIYNGDISNLDTAHYWITSDIEQVLSQGIKPEAGLKQYRIKDAFFQDLKFAYKATDKLGNF